jgi:quercetin dioxygenase-like cupin family protein
MRGVVKMKNSGIVDVPGCHGTSVEMIGAGIGFQVLRVAVLPGGEIPLHRHDCAATMVILSGTARALGAVERIVKSGDVIAKSADEPHGFTDVDMEFVFLSVSTGDGIMHGAEWDVEFIANSITRHEVGP